MTMAPKTAYAHITKDPSVCGGSACIDNTRIRVIDIVLAKNDGQSPEHIRDLFAVKLTLAQVYSALAYADENREEIEADFAEHERVGKEGERTRDEYLKRHSGQ
jgi:uncharacterized protein (DUF433 family)